MLDPRLFLPLEVLCLTCMLTSCMSIFGWDLPRSRSARQLRHALPCYIYLCNHTCMFECHVLTSCFVMLLHMNCSSASSSISYHDYDFILMLHDLSFIMLATSSTMCHAHTSTCIHTTFYLSVLRPPLDTFIHSLHFLMHHTCFWHYLPCPHIYSYIHVPLS